MNTRLVQLSDPHFGGENVEAVEAAVAFTQARQPDLVIISGDLTLNGPAKGIQAAEAWLTRLPNPRLVTPGNHDTPLLEHPVAGPNALRPLSSIHRSL